MDCCQRFDRKWQWVLGEGGRDMLRASGEWAEGPHGERNRWS